ncbi:MAG: trypsin-like peptidase domain-containing protein [Pyrinomonadaceae bacterium]|nr:trypsin-like peptidase domain-containing protein [Pyrinomonadaceae bacterium]
MTSKPVYQLSARQLILLAVSTALIAVAASLLLFKLSSLWESNGGPGISFAETAPAGISDPSTVSDEQNSIEVYRTIAPGVAFINTTSYSQNWWGDVQEGRGNGSGLVIDNQGHILTNYHVIERAQKVTVSFGGDKVYPARVIGGDPDTDLAVIKIDSPPANLPVVPFGDSDKLIVGQKVLAIGNPFGLDRTLTTGVISGLQRPIRARNDRPIDAAIQTDASINPGNSGGPLLDKFGRMIGINSQILSPAGGSVGVGFAVPVNTAKRVVPQLIQFGEVRRPKLAADLRSVEDLANSGYRLPVEEGLLVGSVMPGGAAANSGLRGLSRDADGSLLLGDIIISIDGERMKSTDDLYRLLDRKQFGETVQAEIYRGGRNTTVPIRLTPPPAAQTTRRVQE